MRISFCQRIKRARAETKLLSVKADIFPAPVAAVATGIALQVAMNEVAIAVCAGLVALLVYWVLINVGEFAWNFMRAGERIALGEVERLRGIVGDPDKPVITIQPEMVDGYARLAITNHFTPNDFAVSIELDGRDTGRSETPFYAPWRENKKHVQRLANGPPPSRVDIAGMAPQSGSEGVMGAMLRAMAKGEVPVWFYSTTLDEGRFHRALMPNRAVRLTATVRGMDAIMFVTMLCKLWVDDEGRLHFEEAASS